jgi:hypothetical protein
MIILKKKYKNSKEKLYKINVGHAIKINNYELKVK